MCTGVIVALSSQGLWVSRAVQKVASALLTSQHSGYEQVGGVLGACYPLRARRCAAVSLCVPSRSLHPCARAAVDIAADSIAARVTRCPLLAV